MRIASRAIVAMLGAVALVGFYEGAAFGQTPPRSQEAIEGDIVLLTRLLASVEAQQVADTPPSPAALGAALANDQQAALKRFNLGDAGLAPERIVRDLSRLLIRAHVAYKDLKSEVRRARAPALSSLTGALEDLRNIEHRVLSRSDLYEPIGAVLRGGYSLADPGDEAGSPFVRNDLATEHSAAFFVEFESKHYRDEESWLDYSYGGRTGFLPLMTIVAKRPEAAGSATPPPPALLPSFQNGYAWSLNGRANVHLRIQSELSGFVRIGQGRLGSLTVTLGEGENAKVADTVRNEVGRWAWSREAGVEFRAYRQDLDDAHLQKEFLLPMFSLSTGLRWDERFRNTGPLKAFTSADERWFFRFSVNLVKVVDSRIEGAQAKPYALRVSVDHDHARGDSGVPSGTRLFLEADANLLKLLKPGAP
jgi:hypothetical protein